MAFLDADPEIDDCNREPHEDEQPCAVRVAAFAAPVQHLEEDRKCHRQRDADDHHEKSTHGVSPTRVHCDYVRRDGSLSTTVLMSAECTERETKFSSPGH